MSREDAGGAAPDGGELGDWDRVLAEAPASPIGGMWFTPDESTPGGVRPLTETELREATARVLATQGGAVDLDAIDWQIRRTNQDLVDADVEQPEHRGYCRTGEHLDPQRDSAADDVDDVWGDQR